MSTEHELRERAQQLLDTMVAVAKDVHEGKQIDYYILETDIVGVLSDYANFVIREIRDKDGKEV